MIYARALMLTDGASDEPLGKHVAALARRHGVMLDVVTPEFQRMHMPPGRRVKDRLGCILDLDPDFDVLVVHRDAEGQQPHDRVSEIAAATEALDVPWPTVPVIPVRMTEAWLVLDEPAIRDVAGRPTGTDALRLPSPSRVEREPDPKQLLQQALAVASGLSGRRLRKFERDFPAHRRQLLDRMDRDGPVRQLRAWQALEAATQRAMSELAHGRSDRAT